LSKILASFVIYKSLRSILNKGDVNHLLEVLRRKLEEIALNSRIAYDMTKYKWDTIAEQMVEVYERLRG
jgi:hypothetical protein